MEILSSQQAALRPEFLTPYFDGLPAEYRSHWLTTRRAWYLRIAVRDLWTSVKSLQEKYRRYQDVDAETVRAKARVRLEYIRILSG